MLDRIELLILCVTLPIGPKVMSLPRNIWLNTFSDQWISHHKCRFRLEKKKIKNSHVLIHFPFHILLMYINMNLIQIESFPNRIISISKPNKINHLKKDFQSSTYPNGARLNSVGWHSISDLYIPGMIKHTQQKNWNFNGAQPMNISSSHLSPTIRNDTKKSVRKHTTHLYRNPNREKNNNMNTTQIKEQ